MKPPLVKTHNPKRIINKKKEVDKCEEIIKTIGSVNGINDDRFHNNPVC